MKTVKANESWMALRLKVERVCPLNVVMGDSGLLCIGVPEINGCPPLVAICDETAAHGGASATNSMEGVLCVLQAMWASALDVRKSNVIELDSLGQWDVVFPRWNGSRVENVSFQAVKWVGCRAGSKESLLGVFGVMGAQVLKAMEAMAFHG